MNELSSLDGDTGAGGCSASTGGSSAFSPLVVTVLDTLANIGVRDWSSVKLVDSHDFIDSGGCDSITLVSMVVSVMVTLGGGQGARSSDGDGRRELHGDRDRR